MSDVVIRVENLSKHYRLGTIGGATLREDMQRWWAQMRGKPDPLAPLDGRGRPDGRDHWALRDVSFEVKRGEVLGIIGRNGAGKSTLLKILSRTTAPTSGRAMVKGRIGSLLEVGTGFHPELTGRENIYLNGSILGMRRSEIDRKIDEIIEFSGVERFIDTPVKRYSSGMYVRLAFAVAAHLDPEILVIDEVLAVGDSEFQRRCLGRMQELSHEGRTVFFVSHSMPAIQSLCSRAIWLDAGCTRADGSNRDVVSDYLESNRQYSNTSIAERTDRTGSGAAKLTGFRLLTSSSEPVRCGARLRFEIAYSASQEIRSPKIKIGIYDANDAPIYGLTTDVSSAAPASLVGNGAVSCITGPFNVTPGICIANIAFFSGNELVDYVPSALSFFLEPFDFFGTGKLPERSWTLGLIDQQWDWKN